jgi:succinate dehydrogenase/fumarate reductase flavoprotein subunit
LEQAIDLIVVDGIARGIVTRDMTNGEIESWTANAVVLATGGYGGAPDLLARHAPPARHAVHVGGKGATGFGIGSALFRPGRSAADVAVLAQRFAQAWRNGPATMPA